MKTLLMKLWIKAQILREDNGQDLIEYAMLAALLSLVAIATIAPLGARIAVIWGDITTALTPAA